MPRKDYDELKQNFADFVETWKTKDLSVLDKMIVPNASVRISSAPNSNDSQDKLEGIKQFVMEYPKTDVLQLAIYNYACRMHQGEAQMAANVICESLNYVDGQEEMDAFYYAITCGMHWEKNEGMWMCNEIHMDVYPFYGNLRDYFEKTWYFGSKLAISGKDGRLPAFVAEYDLPWLRIPEAEDVLTEIEKVKECYAKCFLAADYSVNDLRCVTRSKHMSSNARKFGLNDGVRNTVNALRYKRLRDRYWAHPFRFGSIEFNETKDWAICKVYRVFGWKQRNHEYVWTRKNVGIEHVCMSGYQEFVKEDGEWKMAGGNSKLGLYELGPYSETYYGDSI